MGEDGIERIYQEALRRTVAEIMTTPAYSVQADAPLREVQDVMFRHDVKHVLVLQDDEQARRWPGWPSG